MSFEVGEQNYICRRLVIIAKLEKLGNVFVKSALDSHATLYGLFFTLLWVDFFLSYDCIHYEF